MKRVFTVAVLSFGLLLSIQPAYATHEGRGKYHIVHECVKEAEAKGAAPPLECALKTFGNVAQLILGITGSVALLMFVYGGFLLLASGGSEDKITKGKEVIRNAVFGIVIIMTSGLLIRYGLSRLKVQYPGAPCQLSDGRIGEMGATPDASGNYPCQAIVKPPAPK